MELSFIKDCKSVCFNFSANPLINEAYYVYIIPIRSK